MYLKNISFLSGKSYVRWLLLVFAVLALSNISCKKKIESQITDISEETVKEEVNIVNIDATDEACREMNDPGITIWEKKNPPRITIEVTTDPQKKVLTLAYSVKNTTGEPIYLFYCDPPFIRLTSEQQILFMSLMPAVSRWGYARQYVPPVVRLEINQGINRKVCYSIPLFDTYPYLGGPASIPLPINDEMSREARMYIGYFPVKDMKRELLPAENIFRNGFRRQLLVKSNIIRFSVHVRRPRGWGVIKK